ncbi:MAG: hypothetical protein KC731_04925 [Myxococcales bacterium]|nr:hypothetical protein [Myxococcales bacterium]
MNNRSRVGTTFVVVLSVLLHASVSTAQFRYEPLELPGGAVEESKFVEALVRACDAVAKHAGPYQADTDVCAQGAAPPAGATTIASRITAAEKLTPVVDCAAGKRGLEDLASSVGDLATTCTKLRHGTAINVDDLLRLRAARDTPRFLDFVEKWGAESFAKDKALAAFADARGEFSGAGVITAPLAGFSDDLIRGFGEFLATRAKQEALAYLRKQLREKLCAANARPFFEHTCDALDGLDEAMSLEGIATYVRAAAEEDLRRLPDVVLAWLGDRYPQATPVVLAARLGWSMTASIRKGAAPLDVVALLSDLPAQTCEAPAAGGASCVELAAALRFASSVTYATLQIGDGVATFFERLDVESVGVAAAAVLLLAEKRMVPHAALFGRVGLTVPFDPTTFAKVRGLPVDTLQPIRSLIRRWKDLRVVLEGEDGPSSREERRQLLLDALAAAIGDVTRLVRATARVTITPAAMANLEAHLNRLVQLTEIGVKLANQQVGPAMVAFSRALHQLVEALSAAQVKMPEGWNALLPFIVELANAKSSGEVAAAMDAFAAPLGTYEVKYRRPLIALNALVGAFAGGERLDESGVSRTSGFIAGFAPVGFHGTIPVRYDGGAGCVHFGLMLSLLDLGALTTYRFDAELNGKLDDVEGDPEEAAKAKKAPTIGFGQVFSPGAFLTVGIAGSPFIVGGGVSLSPELREVTQDDITTDVAVLRAGAFVAVDVPILPLN